MQQACILIADDHQLFIDGIGHILKKLANQVDISTCGDAEQALAVLESGREFDLILLDLEMPGVSGLSILQRMHASGRWLPIVVVSGEENIHTIKDALEAGALGFVPKSHNSKQMLAALRTVLDGEIYVPRVIQEQIDALAARRAPKAGDNDGLKRFGITARQLAVLKLLAKGYSNKSICSALYLSEHTVKSHVSALLKHLNAGNRTECVQRALREGLLKV